MENLITKLIELVEKASPELWRIARQQVVVDLIGQAIGMVIMTALGIVSLMLFLYLMRSMLDKERDFGDDEFDFFFLVLTGISSVVCIFAVVFNIDDIVGRIVNPDYYAIKILVDLVKEVGE